MVPGLFQLGIPVLNRNNQPIEMCVLTNLKDTVATDVLIGCLPIGTRCHQLVRNISGLCAARVSAKNPRFLQDAAASF
jgi:hypothetical protein